MPLIRASITKTAAGDDLYVPVSGDGNVVVDGSLSVGEPTPVKIEVVSATEASIRFDAPSQGGRTLYLNNYDTPDAGLAIADDQITSDRAVKVDQGPSGTLLLDAAKCGLGQSAYNSETTPANPGFAPIVVDTTSLPAGITRFLISVSGTNGVPKTFPAPINWLQLTKDDVADSAEYVVSCGTDESGSTWNFWAVPYSMLMVPRTPFSSSATYKLVGGGANFQSSIFNIELIPLF